MTSSTHFVNLQLEDKKMIKDAIKQKNEDDIKNLDSKVKVYSDDKN